jgi:hypothetical protein
MRKEAVKTPEDLHRLFSKDGSAAPFGARLYGTANVVAVQNEPLAPVATM